MGRLIYTVICSLDGYINDADGNFDFAAPDAEVHANVNAGERGVGVYLYGRRMYETMKVWQDEPTEADPPAVIVEYADLWRAADKIVYSTTLAEVSTPRTELRRSFDVETTRREADATETNTGLGSTGLAALALQAGIVDEIGVYAVPSLVGGGTRAFPADARLDLELREEFRFGNGTVFLRYAVKR